MNKQTTGSHQTIFPAVRYTDARSAIAWLQRAFAAEPHAVHDAPDGTVAHAELIVAGNMIMLGNGRDDGYPVRSPKEVNCVTGSFYVVVRDAAEVDALHARAAAGAQITRPPHDTD